jgi:hypothetical protein
VVQHSSGPILAALPSRPPPPPPAPPRPAPPRPAPPRPAPRLRARTRTPAACGVRRAGRKGGGVTVGAGRGVGDGLCSFAARVLPRWPRPRGSPAAAPPAPPARRDLTRDALHAPVKVVETSLGDVPLTARTIDGRARKTFRGTNISREVPPPPAPSPAPPSMRPRVQRRAAVDSSPRAGRGGRVRRARARGAGRRRRTGSTTSRCSLSGPPTPSASRSPTR